MLHDFKQINLLQFNYNQVQLMQSSRVQSKMEVFLKDFSAGFTQQQVNHSFCSCQLCVNNVKPIRQPEQLRQSSQKQVNIQPSDTFFYVLSKCINYKGTLFIPEIIFLQEGTLFYTNEWGRLRNKDKLTNQEAKKYFDERKQKTKVFRGSQKQKDSYLLMYKSGTQQVMNEAFYNKILAKRKNDPFWTQAIYSYKMPQPKDKQSSLKIFSYKRTKSKAEYMIPIMEKVMKQVDNNDEKLNRQETLKNMSYMSLDDNLLNSIQVPISSRTMNSNNVINSAQIQMANSQYFVEPQSIGMRTQRSKFRIAPFQIKDIVQEMIAYLQVSSKIRVLELQLQYTQDSDGQPVIIHFEKFICYELSSNQQTYLHDRYKELESIGEKELVQLKKYYDAKDEQALWNVCVEILQSCLEQRKIKLRIQDYKRPTKKTCREIYSKFFPNFSPLEMFQNVNWKNELPKFMSTTRQQINDIIESDEGISILKRFNIYFYRTF